MVQDYIKKIKYKHSGITPNIVNNVIMLYNNKDMLVDRYSIKKNSITLYFAHSVIESNKINTLLKNKYNLIRS